MIHKNILQVVLQQSRVEGFESEGAGLLPDIARGGSPKIVSEEVLQFKGRLCPFVNQPRLETVSGEGMYNIDRHYLWNRGGGTPNNELLYRQNHIHPFSRNLVIPRIRYSFCSPNYLTPENTVKNFQFCAIIISSLSHCFIGSHNRESVTTNFLLKENNISQISGHPVPVNLVLLEVLEGKYCSLGRERQREEAKIGRHKQIIDYVLCPTHVEIKSGKGAESREGTLNNTRRVRL